MAQAKVFELPKHNGEACDRFASVCTTLARSSGRRADHLPDTIDPLVSLKSRNARKRVRPAGRQLRDATRAARVRRTFQIVT